MRVGGGGGEEQNRDNSDTIKSNFDFFLFKEESFKLIYGD